MLSYRVTVLLSYRSAAHGIYNLKYSVPENFTIALHNGSNYNYHFIIKEPAEEHEKHFTCLGETLRNTQPSQFQ